MGRNSDVEPCHVTMVSFHPVAISTHTFFFNNLLRLCTEKSFYWYCIDFKNNESHNSLLCQLSLADIIFWWLFANLCLLKCIAFCYDIPENYALSLHHTWCYWCCLLCIFQITMLRAASQSDTNSTVTTKDVIN